MVLSSLAKYSMPISILLFLTLAAGATFVRFTVQQDYMVQYEIDCDSSQSSCFVGCEDDECTETYDYAYKFRYAKSIFEQCGEDITDCDAAQTCAAGEAKCSDLFCDPTDELNECSTLDDKDSSLEQSV